MHLNLFSMNSVVNQIRFIGLVTFVSMLSLVPNDICQTNLRFKKIDRYYDQKCYLLSFHF